MATDIVDIRAKIISMLQTLTEVDSANIFNYERNDIAGGYPFITVTYRGFNAVVKSQNTNWRTFTYKIKIYQERSNTGKSASEAELKMAETVDEILTMFDTNITLDGTVNIATPIDGDCGYHEKTMDRYCEINLHCTKLVSTT